MSTSGTRALISIGGTEPPGVEKGVSEGSSLLLETLTVELQRATIFSNRPDQLVCGPVRKPGFDFDRHGDFGPHLPGQMRNDFVGDPPGVSANAA